jgi:hypothetical protein
MTTTYDVPDTTETMLGSRAKFAAKLAKAQAEMPSVPKDGKHPKGWKFQSADSIFAVCRPLLAHCGLALLPSVDTLDKGEGATKGGTDFGTARVRVTFTLIDTETGYSESGAFYGDALDYGGMEVQKAMTIAAKLFLKSLFLISEAGDDPDEDDHDAPPPTAKPAPKPAASKPAPPVQTAPANGSKRKLVDTPVLNHITALANGLGYSTARLDAKVKELYEVDGVMLLTVEAAADLVERLERATAEAVAAKQKATAN